MLMAKLTKLRRDSNFLVLNLFQVGSIVPKVRIIL